MHHPSFISRFFSLAAAALILLGTAPAFAQFDGPDSARDSGAFMDGHNHVDVGLIANQDALKVGDSFLVGVLFEINRDWHIYWENPGDAGLPTQIEWTAPGVEFGPLQWSAPGIYAEQDGQFITFGYEDQVVLYSEATLLESSSDSIELVADIQYLACKNACIPGAHVLSRTLEVADESRPADPLIQRLFDEFSLKVPRNIEDLGFKAQAYTDPEVGTIIELVTCQGPDESCDADTQLIYDDLEYAFVPTSQSDIQSTVSAVKRHPTVYKGWILELNANAPDEGAHLSGVLRLKDGDGTIIPAQLDTIVEAANEATIPLFVSPAEPADTATDTDTGAPSLIYILLLAFIGGMILNLMPCVFPVLAIKAASFAEMAGKSRSAILANGAAYTAGITGSLLLLGSVVAGLQLAGTQVGWGFQFQQPLFLAALTVILVIFGLNAFGVFEVTLGAGGLTKATDQASGLKKSVAEGVLAVVLATPCSAPFLGTAVGFALASGPFMTLLIFFVLGLGLAAPFVALTLIPGAHKVLPRPGAWMSHLKTFLGFALFGASIWLVWLVGRVAGVDAMGKILALLGAISIAAWIFGLVQFLPWGRKKEAGLAAALAITIGAAYLTFPLEEPEGLGPLAVDSSGVIDWQPWDKDAIATELDQGRKVFVDFTADWCLTCKTNERTSITDARVLQAISTNNIAMFRADWTRPDESIRQELANFGRGGVPMYLFYSPENPDEPELLPELLSPNMLLERFQ